MLGNGQNLVYMKDKIYQQVIALLLILAGPPLASQTIICPSDTVALITAEQIFDASPTLDIADAVVDGWTSFDLDREVQYAIYDCQSADTVFVTQTATNGNQSLQCTTQIVYPIYGIENIPVADSVLMVSGVTIEQLHPDLLTPGLLLHTKNLLSTYHDIVLPVVADTFRVIRRINHLDWCTGEVVEFIQVIRVSNLNQNGNVPSLYIPPGYDSLSITGPGITATTLEVCSAGGNSPREVLNCIHNFTDDEVTMRMITSTGRRDDISTLDQALTSRHILGITPLDSPGERWSADINSDGLITGSDIVLMRSLILAKVPNEIGDYFGLATINPTLGPDTDGSLTIPIDSFPLGSDFRIFGVKKGDVNQSSLD